MSKKINLEKINYILMILTIILLPILKMTSYLLEYNKIIEKSFEFNHVYFLWIMLPLLLVIYVIHLFKNYKKINYIDIIVYIIMILMLLTTIFSSNKDLSIYGNITRNEGLLTQLTYYLLFLNSRLITKEKYKENIIKVFIGTSIFIMMIEKDTPSGYPPNTRIAAVIRPQPIPNIILPLKLTGLVV
jgi:hypothetical protein